MTMNIPLTQIAIHYMRYWIKMKFILISAKFHLADFEICVYQQIFTSITLLIKKCNYAIMLKSNY